MARCRTGGISETVAHDARLAKPDHRGDTLWSPDRHPQSDRHIGPVSERTRNGRPADGPQPGKRGKTAKIDVRQTAAASSIIRMTSMQPAAQTDTPADDAAVAAALGRVPSGLFVVAWREGDADRCMLASWVMQAGFTPPQVSVAVATSRTLLGAIDRGAGFTVSVLAESQRSLLARFGKPDPDPFAGLEVVRTAGGAAALADAAAWLDCRPTARASAGDHVVVLAEVRAAGGTGFEPAIHLRKNGLRY